ncbi:hypothetical protein ACQ4M3_36365 [Leptolyngbya sp. AN03gr2]|uniref:hypothetical protein n=1 Tax=unclassified Leptolyngbya TaxID=2650499 RepID=UPI003D321992
MSNIRFTPYDESTDSYYATRQFLTPQYRYLPTEELESLLTETFPEMSPEDAENFFRSIGRSLGQFGQEVGRRAPGIVSGALSGATTGAALGPFGAIGGAIAGGALGGATYRPRPGATPASIAQQMGGQALGALGRRGGTAGLIGQFGQTAMGALAGGQRGARGQFAALLAQPQTQQAILRSLGTGSGSVRVGGQSVPIQSILAALGTFATRAAEEYEMLDESFAEANGFDPANPDVRAHYLLESFYQANESLFTSSDESWDEEDESTDESDESWDEDAELLEFDEFFYEMLDDFQDNDD